MDYDILVVGGGIAGMESALTLGDMGYSVLLVEKEPTIGGKMILLSKVFPTLDCASCIATPKMASTFHHPQVTTMTYTEVDDILKTPQGTFRISLTKKSTYVDFGKCTGCQKCEFACTVAVPDQFNFDLVGRRAAYIPFPQAVPKKAVIEKQGSSPCSFACPVGMKPHGYVSLIRSGLFEEAMDHIMKVTSIPGSLGRTCPAPCESECTRGELEGTVPIRKLKRFAADYYYDKYPQPKYGPPKEKFDKKVAVVGSGPAGLTAAYHLAKSGYQVTIFEAEKEPGGMLRVAIPSYRLPRNVVDRDIKNVTALGVEIKTGHYVESLVGLKEEGFDAVFAAIGATQDIKMKIDGEDLRGVIGAVNFLKSVNKGDKVDLSGKTVMVVGGGNVAIDSARVARRLGAKKVFIQYRRSRAEMPAFEDEIEDMIEEDIELQYLKTPVRFIGEKGKLTKVESIDMKLGDSDGSGRRRPVPVEGSESSMKIDLSIIAIGQRPDIATLIENDEPKLTRWNTLVVDSTTLETNIPGVFAGGDVVSGPATVVEAINAGARAAEYMGRYLRGEQLPGKPLEQPLPVVDQKEVLRRQKEYQKLSLVGRNKLPPGERVLDFREVELPLTEDEARYSANRCLDCGGCSGCGQCISACPADAIDMSMQDEKQKLEVGSVVISTGFELFDANLKVQYGFDRFPNVITAMQMDRLLAPTRPYNTVLRPSDGKIPDNIAYVLCTGSRDCQVGNELCSRVCCMYSIKQAQLIMGTLPLADVTIYFIDIRAFGKGFEEFYQQAKQMGIYFVKGKVAKMEQVDNGNIIIHHEKIDGTDGKVEHTEHDMVVLSVGMLPNQEALSLLSGDKLEADSHHYVKEVDEDHSPAQTSVEGVYVAGSSSAVMDIPDTILHSGAAAALAAAHVERVKT
ncbi:MAG: FAD-dependent oxidoreductase [candidate division Zixibacteria bacterium]|nr:FAD-dependent oxidoreductase [candidate division Zixibacteria bacterium]